MNCPCGTGLAYSECCEPFHSGASNPPTAERLMRSRYTAYAMGLPEYLLKTWHGPERPKDLTLDERLHWYRLDILSRTRGGMLDNEGNVEFLASYRFGNQPGSQHELSKFVRESGTWFYVGESEVQ